MKASCEWPRRQFLLCSTALGAAAASSLTRSVVARPLQLSPTSSTSVPPHPATINRAPLASQYFYQLPLGAVRPSGWLKDQLQIQADGMGGRLDEVWPDVGPNSGWLGGSGESWERGPYYLDGLVPLAWMLDSPKLKAKAQRFIDWTLATPRADGMFGPASNDDWWPRMVMLKVLIQYQEATGDERVIPLMTNYFHYQLKELPKRPLRDWGRFRWQDEIVSVIWLYNRTGDSRLLELAQILKSQGFDWKGLFADFPYRSKVTKAEIGLENPKSPDFEANGLKDPALSVHGVNNAQGIKTSPLWSLFSGDASDRDAVFHQLAMLDTYHGLPNGIFSADEHLAGRSPSQGVELCTVVETLYSLELALAVTGDAGLGDRIEKIAYNALPGTLTDDIWAHQYDQQPNQIRCSQTPGPWTTNGPESNLFGLAPHFGCCTANFHQGWPKLTASLWMASADGGLAATLYAPCEMQTTVDGVPVSIVEQTDYPFKSDISITVKPAKPHRFPLHFRIPSWAQRTTLYVNGRAAEAVQAGTFHRVEREWRAGDVVSLSFYDEPETSPGYNGALSVQQGPLVFSLPIEEQWTKLRDHGLTADWQVLPQSAWRFGLPANAKFTRVERDIGPVPFSRKNPPTVLLTEGFPVSDWEGETWGASPPPAHARRSGIAQRLVLMPYGAPKLRVTAFPVVSPPEPKATA